MVLIERTVTKGEKEVLLEEVKKSNAKLKKKQGPNKTKKELAQPAMEISRSLGKAMTEETRQQMVGTLKALAYINAPLILMQLVSMVYRANGDMPMDLDMVEYFAGKMAVTKCWARNGWKCCPYEILLDSSTMDILSPIGFALALCMACRLKRGGFALLATVCSTWVWISRSSTGRNQWNPLGRRGVRCVEDANEMVAKMTLILWLLQAKNCVWVYEQPSSSLLWHHPRMVEYIRKNLAWKIFTWMGGFNADSPKGTVLWSSSYMVRMLARSLPDRQWNADMTVVKTSKHGKKSVTGGAGLKSSQTYTTEFGMSTLSMWLSLGSVPTPDLSDVEIPNMWGHLSKKDSWSDANLAEVFQYLSLN